MTVSRQMFDDLNKAVTAEFSEPAPVQITYIDATVDNVEAMYIAPYDDDDVGNAYPTRRYPEVHVDQALLTQFPTQGATVLVRGRLYNLASDMEEDEEGIGVLRLRETYP